MKLAILSHTFSASVPLFPMKVVFPLNERGVWASVKMPLFPLLFANTLQNHHTITTEVSYLTITLPINELVSWY